MRVRFVPVVAAVIALGACGGDGGGTASETDGSSTGESSSSRAAEGSEGGGYTIAFDPAALPTTSVVLPTNVVPLPEETVTPVLADACAALPAAEFDEITNAVDAEFSLGDTYEFDASADGATCSYGYETHRLRIIVGSATEVYPEQDAPGWVAPMGTTDEITTAPFSEAPDVTLVSDTLGELTTPFAAYTTADDLGIFVVNSGGTGIDSSTDGVLFGRLAAAAAERLPDVERLPATGGTAQGPASDPLPDLCALWSADELKAFLTGYDTTWTCEPSSQSARWDSQDRSVSVNLRSLTGQAATDGVSESTPVDASTPIYLSNETGAYLVEGDLTLYAAVSDSQYWQSEKQHGNDAAAALLRNILDRIG